MIIMIKDLEAAARQKGQELEKAMLKVERAICGFSYATRVAAEKLHEFIEARNSCDG